MGFTRRGTFVEAQDFYEYCGDGFYCGDGGGGIEKRRKGNVGQDWQIDEERGGAGAASNGELTPDVDLL